MLSEKLAKAGLKSVQYRLVIFTSWKKKASSPFNHRDIDSHVSEGWLCPTIMSQSAQKGISDLQASNMQQMAFLYLMRADFACDQAFPCISSNANLIQISVHCTDLKPEGY